MQTADKKPQKRLETWFSQLLRQGVGGWAGPRRRVLKGWASTGRFWNESRHLQRAEQHVSRKGSLPPSLGFQTSGSLPGLCVRVVFSRFRLDDICTCLESGGLLLRVVGDWAKEAAEHMRLRRALS